MNIDCQPARPSTPFNWSNHTETRPPMSEEIGVDTVNQASTGFGTAREQAFHMRAPLIGHSDGCSALDRCR